MGARTNLCIGDRCDAQRFTVNAHFGADVRDRCERYEPGQPDKLEIERLICGKSNVDFRIERVVAGQRRHDSVGART
jgi:hypothetical protein